MSPQGQSPSRGRPTAYDAPVAILSALLATVPMLIGGPYGPVLHVTQHIGNTAAGRPIMPT